MTCVLALSHSCAAVVLWDRAVYSDCLPLFPVAQIRAGSSTGLRQTSSTVTPHQDVGFSIVRHNEVNLGPSTPSLSSPVSAPVIIILRLSALHRLPSLPAVLCTDHVFSRRTRGSVHGTFIARRISVIATSLRQSSNEFAECACIRTASGFLKCVVARSATMLILLARTDCVKESHTPPL